MKRKSCFEELFEKEDEYKMSIDLDPYFTDVVMSIQGFSTEEQLKEHLKNVVLECDFHTFFDIVKKEFNSYLNTELDFEFYTWYNRNHLEFRQFKNQVFMSTSSFICMICFYSFLLYQADYRDDEAIKKMCFQNAVGIIKDSCLWNCEPVSINSFKIILDEIRLKGNYFSLACVLTNLSMCFAWLHEMSHFYLQHTIAVNNKQVEENEIKADNLAYKVFLTILEKNKNNKFQGGAFTSSFQEYGYLAPNMFLGFMHAVRLVEKILYNKEIGSVEYEIFNRRRDAIIDCIDEIDNEIDTDVGNSLYHAYEESLDIFARSLVATEKSGKLDMYKNGGWEIENAQNLLKKEYNNTDVHCFIDSLSDFVAVKYVPISQSFTGIVVPPTGELSGNALRLKISLRDIIQAAVLLSTDFSPTNALSNMIIAVDLISKIYNNSKKYLSSAECAILITLKKLIDEKGVPVLEETLKNSTIAYYKEVPDELIFRKGVSRLQHLKCIEIVEGCFDLSDFIYVKYDY